ncbi:hypothetical protein QQM39_45525 [Streptomyces sp. DT2A-34]|uniref:hypothetical protein n=1 Tax=Streptomyces sp. DT2A-34 TaxID=3051182 RepID=UPI00265B7A3A|nr:hypothetical protein [Streptomyces sp. DT2A-34]MDO0917790.1 hypothetical protein [Streptomyces sp. DT2A-34]
MGAFEVATLVSHAAGPALSAGFKRLGANQPVASSDSDANDFERPTLSQALLQHITERVDATGERLNVRGLAESSGLPPAKVAGVLSGTRVPARAELDLLSLAMGLPPTDRDRLQRLRVKAEAEFRKQQEARAQDQKAAPGVAGALASEAASAPMRKRRSRVDGPPLPMPGEPDPILVSEPEELIEALRAVHEGAGSPSLRELEVRSNGVLKRSTISDMLRGKELPDYDRMMVFLDACGIRDPAWAFIWRRLKASEARETPPWMPDHDGSGSTKSG